MKRILFLAVFLFGSVYANAESEEVKVEKHFHVLDISVDDKDFWDKFKDVIQKAVKDESESCRGAIIKTDRGVIEFRKFPPKKKHGKKGGPKFDKITAKGIALRELHGGLKQALMEFGIRLEEHFYGKRLWHKNKKDNKKED